MFPLEPLEPSFSACYIYGKFRDALSNHNLEAVACLYEMYVRTPNAKANAGFILELDAANDVFFKASGALSDNQRQNILIGRPP